MYVKRETIVLKLAEDDLSPPDGADKGIIPLTCSELFTRVETKRAADPNISFTVEVSYIEVRYYVTP